MSKYIASCFLMFFASLAIADNLEDSDKLLCASTKIMVCLDDGTCFEMFPWEVNVPQFVVVDTKKMTISTTRASDENRSTPIGTIKREDGVIVLQGFEAGRAFSYVIDEFTGDATVAVSSDGLSVSVFGVCTDSDV